MRQIYPELMPVGIDSGLDGAIVGLNGNIAVYAEKIPTYTMPVYRMERDESYDAAVLRDLRGKPWKDDSRRYRKNNELKPAKKMRMFDTEAICQQLTDVGEVAIQAGYAGICVLVEEPQTLVGQRKFAVGQVASTGRFQNAMLGSLNHMKLKWLYVSPISWKQAYSLTSDKEFCISEANRRLVIPEPHQQDDGVCEAALIAWFLKQFCQRYLDAN